MPEMPDLELFSANLNSLLRGKKVTSVTVGKKGRVRASRARLEKALIGKRLERVTRAGKETRFDFSGGTALGVHLMLAGGFDARRGAAEVKHQVLSLGFGGGFECAVFDPRGLASVTLDPEPSAVPDALEVDAATLREGFAKSPAALVKAFLVDQERLRGIGNAYADEILWEARVSPKSKVGKIPPARVTALAKAIPRVLKRAVKSLRKLRPDALSGEDRSFLAVHNAKRKESPGGSPIRVETLAGKKTYYTEEQKLYA